MTDNSILNMVGGEKHINPHYDIKEESANKGFTGIEVNGVRFSNIQEMLVYMDKQRNEIILLKKENAELKEVHESDKRSLRLIAEKGAELEKKISILLSCNNCSENKGGYICQKEYEDKCLAQKIQYIKELKEEIEALANVNIKAQNIIGKAKDLIRNLLRVTYGEGWNYSLDWKVKAEQFLKETVVDS